MTSSSVAPVALGDLLDSRRSAVLLREHRDRLADMEVELLDAPGSPDGPSPVAEVPLELTDDRPGRERRELDSTFRVESVHRLHQRERADLDQVVVCLATMGEASREVLGQARGAPRSAVPRRPTSRVVANVTKSSRTSPRRCAASISRGPCVPFLEPCALCPPSTSSRPCSSTSASRIRSERSVGKAARRVGKLVVVTDF